MKKKSFRILTGAVFAYLAYASFFFITQRNILFPKEYAAIPPGIAERVNDSLKYKIPVGDGYSETWYLPPIKSEANDKTPIIIVGHGNGDLIDRWVDPVFRLREKGYGVLLVEYPGYGRSAGSPSEESVKQVFVASYDLITKRPEIDRNRVFLLGQSIGGGAVCALAKARPTSGMILISSFTKIDVFASDFLLPSFLVKDSFDNISVVASYENPILLIHGKEDSVISFEESEKLLSAAKYGKLISIEGGHNIYLNGRFWDQYVIPFLEQSKSIVFIN